MEEQTYKAINFDLRKAKLEQNIEKLNLQIQYNNVYGKIKSILKNNGFTWEQESGYTSAKGMSYQEVKDIVSQFSEYMPYIKGAVKSITVSSVEGAFDVTDLAKSDNGVEILEPKNIHKLKKNYGLDIKESTKTEKQIRFDFDTGEIQKIFSKEELEEDPIIVYDWTRKFLKDLGYDKVQRSVYKTSSEKPIKEVIEDVLKYSKEYEYLMPALKSFQITCIEDTFDITLIANGDEVSTEKAKTATKQSNEQQIENNIKESDNGISH